MTLIVFPAIDLKRGQVVRLAEGDMDRATVYGDDPAAQALLFADAGAQHLHVVDLDAAREALGSIRMTTLTPRDQADLLVGLGQSLYLGEVFGASAELFDAALGRGGVDPEAGGRIARFGPDPTKVAIQGFAVCGIRCHGIQGQQVAEEDGVECGGTFP